MRARYTGPVCSVMRFILMLTLFVSACGQVGPLVLPEKSKPADKTAPPPPPPGAPEDVERQKKQAVPPSQNPQNP